MPPPDDAYLQWNERIGRFWFMRGTRGAPVYLAVTPRALASAVFEFDGRTIDPETAEVDLITTVRSFYAHWVGDQQRDIGLLARSTPEFPLCVAFLAFSVLAARHMRADDRNRSTAYYARVAELLGCPLVNDLPRGFSKEGFETLWKYVRDWSSTSAVRHLLLPSTEDVYRRYLAYPMGHVGLRQVDLDRLPDFFEWAGYAAGGFVDAERIREDLRLWLDGEDRLTRQGTAACSDERLEVVVQEIAQELATWSGAAEDSAGRCVARVELVLEPVRGLPRLSYLPRRPPGFPEVFEHGQDTFESLQEGWYIPVPVPSADGPALLHGFEWISTKTSPHYVLRRQGAAAIAFVQSEEYAGLTSRSRLLAGVTCAVLYHASVAERVESHIAKLTSSPPARIERAPGLPSGWRCLLNVRIEKPSAASLPGIPAVDVDAAVELMTTGGLRLGRRAAWLRTSPPRILVSGATEVVRIDGRDVDVVDGVVQWDSLRATAGVHVVEAGRAQLRVELVDASVSEQLALLGADPATAEHVLGMARGRWTLIGDRPGTVHEVDLVNHELVRCAFLPTWAIRAAEPGCVLFLGTAERKPSAPPAVDGSVRKWAEAIRGAAQNHAPLACLAPGLCTHARATWKRFQRLAAQISNAPAGDLE